MKNDEEEETSVELVTNNNFNKKEPSKQTSTSGNDKKCFNCGRTGNLKREFQRCYICKRRNHASEDYKFRDSRKEQQSNKSGQENNVKQPSTVGYLGSRSAAQAVSKEVWMIGAGASEHMTGRPEWLNNFEQFEIQEKIEIGYGTIYYRDSRHYRDRNICKQ